MADKNGGKINFQVGFSVDKSGLSQMQSLFQQIANRAAEPGNKLETGLQQAAKTASTLNNILTKTFNTDLGSLNVTKFNQELSKSGLNLKSIKADLSQARNQGVTAFNRLSQAILGTNQQIRQSNKALDQMFTTFKNTVRYGISSSVFNNMANSIQKAFDYSKQLDTSLNDIRIVTDKSAESMAKFAQQANEASKGMGASTLDYTNAALIYYQQGLSDSEVQARAETTIKAANVTGQRGEEVSEQLTAVWNGYKVSAEETELYVDKLAAVAATTAADLEELSVGMSKVASAANAMGVDFDDLNAQIATIVSVTRQAPESVGTALKTIYARLGDLQVDGVDEFGVSLGKVSEQMVQMGIQILDQNGNLRDMTSVIAEVAEKWSGWTEAQRQAAAVAMAGKRQYNNLIALFDNWDMYTSALNTSTEAMGTLQHQQDIYMESTAAKLKTLKAAWQGLYDDAINEDEINGGIEALTNLIEVFDNFISSFGGGLKSVAGFGAILSSVFNRQISESIVSANQRLDTFKNNLALAQQKNKAMSLGTGGELTANASAQQLAAEANSKIQLDYARQIYEARVGLNQEQANSLIKLQEEIGKLEEEAVLSQKQLDNLTAKSKVEQENKDLILQGVAAVDLYQDAYSKVLDRNEQLLPILDEIKADLQISGDYVEEKITIPAIQIYDALQQDDKILNSLTNKERILLEDLMDQNYVSVDLNNSKRDLEKIINRIINLTKKEENNVNNELKAAEQLEQKYKEIQKTRESQNNKRQQADTMLESAKSASVLTQNIMTVTSALGNMAMAWSSVNSLIDTINNKNIDFGDKILQTFMTLGMTLPIVYSNFSKLNEVIGLGTIQSKTFVSTKELEEAQLLANTLAEEANEAATQATILTQEANTAATRANTLAKEEDTLEEFLNSQEIEQNSIHTGLHEAITNADAIATEKAALAEEANTVATQKATLAEEASAAAIQLENKAKAEAIIKSKGHYIEKIKEIIAIKTGKSALDAETQAQLLANAAKMGYIAIAALVVAAIAGIIAYQKKQLENQIKLNKEEIERVNKIQEEIDANKELCNSYDELYQQYENGVDVKNDLYDKTLEIAKAYDIEDAKVLALANRYDVLAEKIKNARQMELEKTAIPETISEVGAAEGNLLGVARQGRGNTINGDYTLGLGKGLSILDENKAMDALYNNSSLYREQGDVISINPDDPQEMLKLYDELTNAVAEMNQEMTASEKNNSEYYKHIVEWLGRMKESVEEYRNALAQLNMYQVENSFLTKEDLNKNSSIQDILNVTKQVRKELQGAMSNEDLDKYIKNYLSGISEISDAYNKINLAEKISDKTDEDLNIIISKIENFNTAQLAFLEIHLDTALLDQDFEEWVNDHQEYLSLIGAQGAKTNFTSLLENYDEKQGIATESVYADPNMAQFMDISKEEYGLLDNASQFEEVANAWIKNTKYVVEYKDKVLEALNAEKEKYSEITEANNERWEASRNQLEKFISANDNYIDKADEIFALVKKLGEEGFDNLTDSEKVQIETFAELNGIGITQLEWLGESISESEKYANALIDVRDRIAEVTETQYDAARAAELYQQAIKLQSASLDDIQSAYKSLVSITEDYNKTGQWTLDNVQALLTMEDKYVAALSLENGQLVINEQTIQQLTLAKIEDLKADVLREAQAKLTALASQDESEQAINAANAIVQAAIATEQARDAASDAIPTLQELADTLAEIGNTFGFSSERFKAGQSIIDSTKNKLKALENIGKNIGAGGSSMRSTMGAGSKSSSGGGGSKDKQKQEKELKQLDEELDRYWEINKALDAIDRSLKKIDKEQEHLNGPELIASLEEENKLLEQQKERYEQLYQAQQAEAAELRGQLSGMGVAFDESSGAILNYAEAVAAALATYNAAVAAFNAGPQDEAAQKSLEAAEKAYENFKKLMERYDTLYYTEMQDTQEKMEDIWRKEMENKLKAWKTKVELELDKNKLEQQWDEFMLKAKKDFKKVWDMRGTQEDSAYQVRTGERAKENVMNTIKRQHEVEADMKRMEAGGESELGFQSMGEARDTLKELDETMRENGDTVYEAYQNVWKNYLDGIDQVADALEMVNSEFERQNEILDYNRQIIELLYGDEAYDLMAKYYQGQYQANINNIASLVKQRDTWREQLENVGLINKKTGKLTIDYKNLTEDQKKLYDHWRDAQSQIYDLTVETVKLLQDEYANEIDKILKKQTDQVKKQREEWEMIKKRSEGYYDSIESTYQIQKLASKYDQSIADAKNLKAQEKLKKLQEEEIDRLRKLKNENKELSEYEIQYANAKYEAALREIALEEAQNNKTSMKLTRDEQGNWSYQYIAEEEDVAAKRQELYDAYNELYQLASDAYEKNLETMISLEEEYYEKLRDIAIKYRDDKETMEEKMAELYDQYYGEDGLITRTARENTEIRQDLETATATLLINLYDQDQTAVESMTTNEKKLVTELAKSNIKDYSDIEKQVNDSNSNISKLSKKVLKDAREDWSSSAQKIINKWNKDKGSSVRAQVEKAYDKIMEANENYKTELDNLEVTADTKFGEDGIKGDIDAASEATTGLLEETERLCDEGSSYIDTLREYVNELEGAWREVCSAIEDAIDLLREYLSLVGEVESAGSYSAGIADYSAPEAPSRSNSGEDEGGNGSGSPNGSSPTSTTENNGKIIRYSVTTSYDDGQGGGTKNFTGTFAHRRAEDYAHNQKTSDSSVSVTQIYENGKRKTISTYATGGYTGSWNNGLDENNGRLAMLHQKELVLNADDTKNFLAGVNTIRDMVASNGSIEAAVLRAAVNMANSLNGMTTPGTIYSGGNTNNSNENIFNITAEFPNANSVDEIREAILSLPNLASQYIHSNLK